MSKPCIVIPTYNESENLTRLLEKIEKVLKNEDFKIIIVDDNSPDKTADIATELNERYGNIIIHRRPKKVGIGSAIRDGLKIALSHEDCTNIITMDSDLSHSPEDIPRLLAESENADLIQGCARILPLHAPFTCARLLHTVRVG